MADKNQEGLKNIIEAINNIVEPKISNSKFDRTFRAKVIEKTENEDYIVQINNINYTLKYAGKLEPNQIVRVKAPLNNFSDIYIESLPGSGGTVIDNLTSTSGTDALSANMRRILDTKVSISEAPPETSNVAKLWVDTSPILTGGNPDLLYNGSESEDWNSLLTPLKNKIFEAYFSSSTYTGSAILGYGDTVIDTTGGRVTANSNGLIKINYDGNVRIKAQFWVKADINARPWTRLEDYDNNRVTLISSIDDMPSGYLTVTIEKIVQNLGIHNYDISVGLNTGGMTINGGSGSDVNSILIVELL